jgi:hypothetical protein
VENTPLTPTGISEDRSAKNLIFVGLGARFAHSPIFGQNTSAEFITGDAAARRIVVRRRHDRVERVASVGFFLCLSGQVSGTLPRPPRL